MSYEQISFTKKFIHIVYCHISKLYSQEKIGKIRSLHTFFFFSYYLYLSISYCNSKILKLLFYRSFVFFIILACRSARITSLVLFKSELESEHSRFICCFMDIVSNMDIKMKNLTDMDFDCTQHESEPGPEFILFYI